MKHTFFFYLKKKGYKTKKTKTTGDFGADIVLEKQGIVTVVQAKRYKGKVSGNAIQEVYTSKNYYYADNAIVVTNSTYTPAAIS